MKKQHLLGLVLGAVFGGLIAVATVAAAQAPSVPAAHVLVGSQALKSPPPSTTRINDETFVSIKDHGDSQTVIVYKVDDKGVARLTHKARFFY